MFCIDLWGFSIDPLLLVYNSIEQKPCVEYFFCILGNFWNSNWARIFPMSIFFPKRQHEKKKHTWGAPRPKWAQVVRAPGLAAPHCLVYSLSVQCRPSWPKTPLYKYLPRRSCKGTPENTRNHETKAELAKIGGGNAARAIPDRIMF
jgi:hypothetical protein